MAIIYQGTERIVRIQLNCDHDWVGPCINRDFRYNQCKRCDLRDFDGTWEDFKNMSVAKIEYLEKRIEEIEQAGEKNAEQK